MFGSYKKTSIFYMCSYCNQSFDVMQRNRSDLQSSIATLQLSVQMKSANQVSLRALEWQTCAKKTMRKLSKVFSKFHQLITLDNDDVNNETNIIHHLVNEVSQLNANDDTVSELSKSFAECQKEILKYTNVSHGYLSN